jgi:RHS repeat-associated protein
VNVRGVARIRISSLKPDKRFKRLMTNSNGITQAHYTDFPGRWGGLTSQRRSGTSSFYAFDLSSNARLLTSSSASQLATYLTDAFGLEKSITGSTTNSFLFSGEVGLYRDLANFLYARARYLSSVKGRWVSRDPIGFGGGVNLFKYVSNGPLTWIDPNGNCCSDPDCGDKCLFNYKNCDDSAQADRARCIGNCIADSLKSDTFGCAGDRNWAESTSVSEPWICTRYSLRLRRPSNYTIERLTG